jgi:elongation factor Ts
MQEGVAENGGDIDAAMEFLRKSGLAKADKKASRVAAEGRIAVAQSGGNAVLVEINSETDFVAKDVNFLGFTDAIARAALASGAGDAEALKVGQAAVRRNRRGIARRRHRQARRERADPPHGRVESDNVAAYVHGGKHRRAGQNSRAATWTWRVASPCTWPQ